MTLYSIIADMLCEADGLDGVEGKKMEAKKVKMKKIRE